MRHIYKVPIIPQNLNNQETIIQIGEVIDHLADVTEDIMGRINSRIDASNRKLAELASRVEHADKKIDKLTGAKSATQVFSSCKYPAADVEVPFKALFSGADTMELKARRKVKHRRPTQLNDEPLDKLYVYHVKVKNNEKPKATPGLGDVPRDIGCVNNLLLYNSGKNLYEKYELSDALAHTHIEKAAEVVDGAPIGAAPHSIGVRSTMTRAPSTSYFYSPNLGEVPALDVPLDLPDLPGIADNLRYETELDPAIAPSFVASSNGMPDLPVIESNDAKQPSAALPSPLPPPPPPQRDVEVAASPPQLPLPPPPPPPAIEWPKADEPPPIPVVDGDMALMADVRASLMEAIRQAGGSKKLRKGAPVEKGPDSDGKPKYNGGSAGGLMADLHAKLALRRKGISGAKKPDQPGGGMDATTVLETISAMIPAPSNVELSDSANEEDWDD